MSKTIKHAGFYANVFSQWSKALGPKPTEAELSLAHVFGRPGKQSLAVAMALRDAGVKGTQIKGASALVDGKATPQLNHLRDLITAGLVNREPVPGAYVIRVTAKGQKFVELHGAKVTAVVKPDKPVKAKANKPRKAKAVPVDVQPVIETPAEQPTA